MRSNHSPAERVVVLGPDDQWRAADARRAGTVLLASRTDFGDGEHLLTLPEVRQLHGRHVLIVQTTAPPQAQRLLSLLQLVEIAASVEPASITCCAPYLCYQRQDRRTRPGEAVTARLVLRALGALGVRALITLDRHSEIPQLPGETPVANLSCADRFAEFVRAAQLRPEIVVSPDAGGTRRAERVAEQLALPSVTMRKLKRPDRGTYYETLPDQLIGRRCLVVEDLCSTGTTLVPLCDWLRPHTARIDILVSHILTSVETIGDRLGTVDTIGYSDSCGDARAPVRVLGAALDAWTQALTPADRQESPAWSTVT